MIWLDADLLHVWLSKNSAPVAQIPQCTSPISHDAPFVTEMCTCVHISVTEWCILIYLLNALWHFWDDLITCNKQLIYRTEFLALIHWLQVVVQWNIHFIWKHWDQHHIAKYMSVGHVALVAATGFTILGPYLKSLHLIWRCGTRRFLLRVPHL